MQRILVIRIDFLGDMVCTTALLHALKQRNPRISE
ncbi:putative sugar transferase [Yersinia pestis str. Pestoides B]|nr:putative sugar transferase [Yersinia pestis str. Pestoides B]EEO92406.1 putative sugar transferase [Yersinia pestis Pestoides A]